MKYLALIAALTGAVLVQSANAQQQWQSYQAPGSPFTSYTGPNGSSATTYQAPGSPFSNTTINNPNGQSRSCTTYQAPGSPFANTSCY